jgi:hypothetical protein
MYHVVFNRFYIFVKIILFYESNEGNRKINQNTIITFEIVLLKK